MKLIVKICFSYKHVNKKLWLVCFFVLNVQSPIILINQIPISWSKFQIRFCWCNYFCYLMFKTFKNCHHIKCFFGKQIFTQLICKIKYLTYDVGFLFLLWIGIYVDLGNKMQIVHTWTSWKLYGPWLMKFVLLLIANEKNDTIVMGQ